MTGFLAAPWAGLLGSPAPGGARAAFIGPPAAAGRLALALDAVGLAQYVLVGCVTYPERPPRPLLAGSVSWVSSLGSSPSTTSTCS